MLKLAATVGGIGHLPVAPGTWASAVAVLVGWVIVEFGGRATLAALAVAVFVLGVWAAGEYAAAKSSQDPGEVVIDEVAGQWLALALAAHSLAATALAFTFFRLYDIAKPWPINRIERTLPGGLGIMGDDIAAGLFAALATWLALALADGLDVLL